jgi:hypothetical protein
MTALQRKAILIKDKFICHKKNGKGNTLIFSRNHPTAKFVRVVVDSGIDKTSGKIVSKAGVKLCYVNRQKSWRVITTEAFTTNTGLVKIIRLKEAAEKSVKTCKHCKAKKFTAKTGNVVCANACWTTWSRSKKPSKPIPAPKKKPSKPLRRVRAAPQTRPRYKIEILPGDLVTVEQVSSETIVQDFTGSILGVVTKVEPGGYVHTNWTANTSHLEAYFLPSDVIHYVHAQGSPSYRFKVLSRSTEWKKI